MNSKKIIQEATDYIIKTSQIKHFDIGIILGSGLNDLFFDVEALYIDYKDIPHFKTSTAPGHQGRFMIFNYANKTIIAMQGRLHYYEGYGMDAVILPIEVFKELGISYLITTNAVGAINENYEVGDIVIIKDHINFMGYNPMIGSNNHQGSRFFDMSNAYDLSLRTEAETLANKMNINTRSGVMLGYSGPCFETPAEIRAFRILGADIVGMSTVPEAIASAHANLKMVSFSLITNMASGVLKEKLNENHIIEIAQAKSKDLKNLILQLIWTK
ncbi:MAG: purine-nucleoside phosphorylase [Bacillales bacterium]|jgi:purine-nucleoside phosphorylase|nr:purine-nucleoside phosphorylase [Bacillales bacterium]